MHYESGVGHLGGNLSCLISCWRPHDVLGPADQFVLSKGHSAGAYYVSLWSVGRLEEEDLRRSTRMGPGSAGIPRRRGIPDILFATGSLGHGLSLAAGLALGEAAQGGGGARLLPDVRRRVERGLVLGGADLRPAPSARNLTIAVDLNGLQGFGTTREVADLDPLADKFRAFGAATREIDGHDHGEIVRALCADRRARW